jgi:hypothetical protein
MVTVVAELARNLNLLCEASLILSTMTSGFVGEDVCITFDAIHASGCFKTSELIYKCYDLRRVGAVKVMGSFGGETGPIGYIISQNC